MLDIWALGVILAECHVRARAMTVSSFGSDDSDPDIDPLDGDVRPVSRNSTRPARLFDDTFGEVGLAASIFRVLGTPTPDSWPVSPITREQFSDVC